MSHALETTETGLRLAGEAGRALATFERNEWETEFFGRELARLSLDEELLAASTPTSLREALAPLLAAADDLGTQLTETRIDMKHGAFVPSLEDLGFRLVDTRICFLTLVERQELTMHEPVVGTIRAARQEDLPAIRDLTSSGFVNNPVFQSRFKNPRYFSAEESERYYAAWIANHLGREDTHFVVLEDGGQVVGYYIYKRGGPHRGELLLKGILSSVAPEYRGQRAQLAMQSFIYRSLTEERWYVDNTTQLTNYPVMKNHIRFGKRLEDIELVFYRERQA